MKLSSDMYFLNFSYSPNSPHLASVVSPPGKATNTPLVRCTNHMCPIRVHWHVKLQYKEYWRVKITITNFNYRMNYSQWNLVVQHPNFDNVTQVFSFNFKPLTPYVGLSKSYSAQSYSPMDKLVYKIFQFLYDYYVIWFCR